MVIVFFFLFRHSISHYALTLNDIQTAAMIAMTFIQLQEQLSCIKMPHHRPNIPYYNEVRLLTQNDRN